MFAADCPTKRAAFMTDMTPGRWSHVPANFSGMGRGSTLEPPCRIPFFNLLQTKPNDSVLRQYLYGFRNLNYCRLRQMEQLHLART